MQDAAEDCHHPELVEQSLRLELKFTLPREHVTELIVLDCHWFHLTCLELLKGYLK